MALSIGESKPRKSKIFSNLIMKFEQTNHSHIFISWKDHLGLRWVAEAKGSGVRIVSNKEFKEDALVVNIYKYETPQENMDSVVRFIWENSSDSYSPKQILGLAIMRMLNYPLKKFGFSYRFSNPYKDGDYSQVCCELALRSLEIATDRKIDGHLEDYGLRETQIYNQAHGVKQPPEKIKRINSNV